jgi:hypothetical protein
MSCIYLANRIQIKMYIKPRLVSSKVIFLLLAFSFALNAPGQIVTDKQPLTNWTRFLEDSKINPAFAGSNGHHVVSAALQHSNVYGFRYGTQSALSYQHRVKTGTGYKIDYRYQNQSFLDINELHLAVSQSLRVSKKHPRYLCAGLETFVYNLNPLYVQTGILKVHGLPALNAGLLYYSKHFYGSIMIWNLTKVYWQHGTSPQSFRMEFPLTPSFYVAYKNKFGIASLSAGSESHFGPPIQHKTNLEAGLLVQVKKVFMAGVKIKPGGVVTGVLSYMSDKRLRAGCSYTFIGNIGYAAVANVSCVLGKKD